jgi:hypothetical protein
MERGRIGRLAPLSGLLFLALLVAAFIVSGEEFPAPDEGAAEAAEYWRSDDERLMIGALLSALAAVPLLWFAGSLRAALRESEGAPGRLSAVAFGGAVLLAGALAIGASLQWAAAESADDVSSDVTYTLSVLNYEVFFIYSVGVSLLLLPAAVLMISESRLPTWLGWVAVVIAIAAFTPVGFFAFVAAALWVAVVSVLLFRRAAADSTAPPAAPPPSPPAA